ncbi:MAG: bifunctional 5,10-methylenetetrahydrofolate dehydrogenase/5,10-methenyltetrahydrofolate cyclohydrolase, partial [Chloroflexi bacterium]
MSAQLLDGKALAKIIQSDLKSRFAALAESSGVAPILAVVRVGDDTSAAGYARAIERTCTGVGVTFAAHALAGDATQAAVEAAIAKLNSDPTIHGVMILDPLPGQIDGQRLIDQLNPAKDVDGVHPLNAGRLSAQKAPYFVPATPAGAIRLLEEAGVEFKGKQAVIIGRSDIV